MVCEASTCTGVASSDWNYSNNPLRSTRKDPRPELLQSSIDLRSLASSLFIIAWAVVFNSHGTGIVPGMDDSFVCCFAVKERLGIGRN